MMKKTSPKYPNRQKVLFRRFATQILLLIAAVCLAMFWAYYQNTESDEAIPEKEDGVEERDISEPETGSAGKSLSAKALAELSLAVQSENPYPSNYTNGNDASQTTEHALPVYEAIHNPKRPPFTAGVKIDDAKKLSGEEAYTTGRPYAHLNLDEITRELTRQYKGVVPSSWGEHLPGVTDRLYALEHVGQSEPARPVVALTFDACGGKKGVSYDADLIAFLREKRIPATLFITSLWLKSNPEIAADLAADPLFEIAAHGSLHMPCSVNGNTVYGIKGTATIAELISEVEGNARDIQKATGKRPCWFRSGTAYYDNVAIEVIRRLGFNIAGYSITGDEGATLSAAKVEKRTLSAEHGDIFLFHMNRPYSGTREGLKKALPKLLERGTVFVQLSATLSCP